MSHHGPGEMVMDEDRRWDEGGWRTMIQAASANKAPYEYDKACKDEKSKNVPSNRINIWYRYIYTSHVYTCLYTDVDSLEDTPRQSKEFKGALPIPMNRRWLWFPWLPETPVSTTRSCLRFESQKKQTSYVWFGPWVPIQKKSKDLLQSNCWNLRASPRLRNGT